MIRREYPVTARTEGLRLSERSLELDVRIESGADRTLLVVEGVRRIQWHLDIRTVEIWLASTPTPSEGACRAPSIPRTCDLPAQESLTLHVRLPRRVFRLTPRAEGDAEVIVDDLRATAQAVLHIQIMDSAFYHTPAGPPVHQQPAAAGQVISAAGRSIEGE